jgi:thiamine-monophosphate kinase
MRRIGRLTGTGTGRSRARQVGYAMGMEEAELRALLAAVSRGEMSVEAGMGKLAAGPQPAAAADNEFARIAQLGQLFAGEHPGVQLGIGDDAAVLHPQAQPLVLSVDVAVEDVHFARAYASWAEIGARAMTAAVSDLAAMGARPLAALSSLVAPALASADFAALHEGIAQAARDYACPVIGGNLASGAQLSLSTTVIGTLEGPGLYRTGAQAGDQIYVSGPLGSAALGLKILQLGAAGRGVQFVAAWQTPRARVQQGLALSGVASAAIDVSDGALADLGHICEASQLGAVLEAAQVPLAPGMVELAHSLGLEPLQLALAGGEDYELIYTLPSGVTDPCGGTRIGHMLDTPGPVRVLGTNGHELSLSFAGWQHFR